MTFVSLNEWYITPSTLFMIPSVACCKLQSHSFWIAKRSTLSRRDNASWHGQVPFCYSLMFKKFYSLPNYNIRVCIKGNRINRGVGYRLLNIYFMEIRKLFNGKREHDGLDGNAKKKGVWNKVIFFKKKTLFPTCVLFFLACLLLGGNFHRDNPNRIWTFCPLMRGVRYFCSPFRGFLIWDLH